jgi:hypothetical protein
MRLHTLTVQQILELTDAELDALSPSEQRLVAQVINAALDFQLRSGSSQDPRRALEEAVKDALPSWNLAQKFH